MYRGKFFIEEWSLGYFGGFEGVVAGFTIGNVP
jgi:hypothetical protein